MNLLYNFNKCEQIYQLINGLICESKSINPICQSLNQTIFFSIDIMYVGRWVHQIELDLIEAVNKSLIHSITHSINQSLINNSINQKTSQTLTIQSFRQSILFFQFG